MSNNLNSVLNEINYTRRRNLKEKRSASEIKANANLMNEYLREINAARKPKPLSAAAQEWNPPAPVSTPSANAPEWNPPAPVSTLSAAAEEWYPSGQRLRRNYRKQSRKTRKTRKTRRARRS